MFTDVDILQLYHVLNTKGISNCTTPIQKKNDLSLRYQNFI